MELDIELGSEEFQHGAVFRLCAVEQIFKNVLGRTQAEVKDKLRKAQEAG